MLKQVEIFYPKKYSLIAILACVVMFKALASVGQSTGEAQADNSFSESYRVSFTLKEPRRYATRYLSKTRELQIKIIPAREEEFDSSKYYDTRFIHRVNVLERNNEVTLTFQLKNFDLNYLVTRQKAPWRLLVDIWPKNKVEKNLAKNEWTWQGDLYTNAQKRHEDRETLKSSSLIEETGHAKALSVILGDKTQKSPKTELNIPGIFSRIDKKEPLSAKHISELERKVGSSLGSEKDYSVFLELGRDLYLTGNTTKALNIFRFLASLSESRFKEKPLTLWYAGESAFLSQNFSMASDYYRALVLNHSGSELSSLSRIRLIDINELSKYGQSGFQKVSSENSLEYSKIALEKSTPFTAQVVASLRVLYGVIDSNPSLGSAYFRTMNNCSQSAEIPKDLKSYCIFNKIAYEMQSAPLLALDSEIQKLSKYAPKFSQTKELQSLLSERVQDFLVKTSESKDWFQWIDFEKKARPELLAFSENNSKFLFMRAEAWRFVGENKNAIKLYENYIRISHDPKMKRDAGIRAAFLLFKDSKAAQANTILERVFKDDDSQEKSSLDRETIELLVKLSLPPYKSLQALNVVVGAMKQGAYHEENLNNLVSWVHDVKSQKDKSYLYSLISAYVPKNDSEVALIQDNLMEYANSLRLKNNFEKSGDIFSLVGHLAGGTRQAEAYYKSGVVYARAGLFEKAKKAWRLSSNDVADKKFSSLASDRLKNFE